MSEDVADLRRQLARMTSQMQRLEAASRQTWGFVPSLGVLGIPRSATVISPSSLPDGPPGTGIVNVPAYPTPIGLPAGIGTVLRVDATGNSTYLFVRIDSQTAGAFNGRDLRVGDGIFAYGITYLDKVSGGTTWRYTCLNAIVGLY
jgi:hypothetical protein